MARNPDNSHTKRFVRIAQFLKAKPRQSVYELAAELAAEREDGRFVDINNLRRVLDQLTDLRFLKRSSRGKRQFQGGRAPRVYELATDFGGLPTKAPAAENPEN